MPFDNPETYSATEVDQKIAQAIASLPSSGGGSGAPVFLTRTAMKASVATGIAFLTEGARFGFFVWRQGNFASKISADPGEGVYVKADSVDASDGAWVRQFSEADVGFWGAQMDGVTDDTSAIQQALTTAHALGVPAVRAIGSSVINGTITLPFGMTLYSSVSAAEYYPGSPWLAPSPGTFVKPPTGQNGPVFILQTGAALRSMYIKHLKAGGATNGIVQIGPLDDQASCFNTNMSDVQIYGMPQANLTGATTCYGVKYPDSNANGKQRYFNRGNGVYVTNCDVAFHLGSAANANNYTGIVTRQCFVHYELIGGSQGCIENAFTGLSLFNIGVMAGAQTTCFKLKSTSLLNNFINYTTECNGAGFDIDASCNWNRFLGMANEFTAMTIPGTNKNLGG